MIRDSPLLLAALDYARRGFRVVPLNNLTSDGQCTCQEWRDSRRAGQCPTPGKHPRFKAFFKLATVSENQIRAWWQSNPQANIGIIGGKESGIWALDTDPRNGGEESRDHLIFKHGRLPWTMTARTGGGGTHEYFRWPSDFDLPAALLLEPGLDIVAEGHVIVAPPSLHPSGRTYAWEPELGPDEMMPVDAPAWLLDILRARVTIAPAQAEPETRDKKDFPPASYEKISAGCAWMRHCAEHAQTLTEPEWYAQLSVLGRCRNGEQLAHGLSSAYSGYTHIETAAKLRRALVDTGPVTCAKVKNSLGGERFCAVCANAGEVRSPVVLGIRSDRLWADAPMGEPPPDLRRRPQDHPVLPVVAGGDVTGQNPPSEPPAAGPGEEDGAPPDLLSFPLTDSGNAERVIAMFGENVRYCVEMKSWFIWDGRRWAVDHSNVMRQKVMLMARQMYVQCLQLPEGSQRTLSSKHALATESSRGITNALVEAERLPGIPVTAQQLDQYPDHLNFLSGTVCLRDGSIAPHDRSMLLTKLIPHRCNMDARAPQFQSFVEWTMGAELGASPDAELTETTTRLVSFLQRVIGYSITGQVTEKCVFVFYGADGDNGKTTLLTLFRELLGRDYASMLLIETIMHARSTDNTAREDMADLRGTRFCQTSEISKEDRLNEQRIKFLTQGMGTIKSRRLHEHLVEFIATHKLLMDCNYRPKVTGQDNAIWRRLIQIPFTATIPEEKKDKGLRERLQAEEAEGILAWAIRGAMLWYQKGLGKPPEVAEAQADWREHDDPIREFLTDWCELDEALVPEKSKPDAKPADEARPKPVAASRPLDCPVSDLMTAYLLWAKEYGEKYPLARRAFNEALVGKGIKQDRRNIGGVTTRIWVGVELKPEADTKLRMLQKKPDPPRYD